LIFRAVPPGSPLTPDGDAKSKDQCPSLGQQLIDLQKAKAVGAITDAEYEAQKAKLLGNK